MPYLSTIAFSEQSAGANAPDSIGHEDIYRINTPSAPTTLDPRTRTQLTSQVNVKIPKGKYGRIGGGFFPHDYAVIGGTNHTHALPTILNGTGNDQLISPFILKTSPGASQTPTADTEMCTLSIMDCPVISVTQVDSF